MVGSISVSMGMKGGWSKDENGTEIFRVDRFHFLYYDIVFYIMIPFSNFVKHKN
jgi:hypothetical protein